MPKTNLPNTSSSNETSAHEPTTTTPAALLPAAPAQTQSQESSSFGSKLATVAAVGVGAALLEVELIPGILIGAAAALAPNLLPKIGNGVRPLVKGVMKAGYAVTERTKETVAEANEHLQDIMAEVRTEQNTPATPHVTTPASEPHPTH